MSAPVGRFLAGLEAGLEERRAAGLYRVPAPPEGIDLTSNDYLGYAADADLAGRVAEAVRRLGVGAGASRLLRGEREVFAEAERRLAAFCGRRASLLLSSGYTANIGVLPALAGPDDLVCSDALNHASLIDGIRLCGARREIFPHQDLDALEGALRRPRGARGRAFIVTESLFSMDGDLTDLGALCDLAERLDALVIVDEAHATALHGERGSGRVEALGLTDRVLCTIHTGGKALGAAGAWVAGEAPLIAHLVNHCRSFIFSTAPMPALAAALVAALERRAADLDSVRALHRKASALRARLRSAGLDLGRSESQIVPLILGSNERALAVAAALRRDGFDVRAVRPPTVPAGTARLRVTVRSPLADADLERFAAAAVARVGEHPA